MAFISETLDDAERVYRRFILPRVRLSEKDLAVDPLTVPRIILWWEIRRIAYNITLLIIGVASVFAFEYIMNECIPKGEDAEEPIGLLLGILMYAFCANAAYTLGWLMELRTRKENPVVARATAQWTFLAGYLFSCALTTAPFWYACLFCAIHGRVPHPAPD